MLLCMNCVSYQVLSEIPNASCLLCVCVCGYGSRPVSVSVCLSFSFIYISLSVSLPLCACLSVHVCLYLSVCLSLTHTHMHMHTCMHAHAHNTHTTHTHTHTRARSSANNTDNAVARNVWCCQIRSLSHITVTTDNYHSVEGTGKHCYYSVEATGKPHRSVRSGTLVILVYTTVLSVRRTTTPRRLRTDAAVSLTGMR